MSVDPQHLDFGTVWEQREFLWELPIHNTTNQPIMISTLATSCQCTATGEQSFKIPPGGEHRVALKLNLLHSNEERVTASRPFSVNIIAQTSASKERPFVWLLKGNVRSVLNLSPLRIELGDVLVGEASMEPQVARVESLTPLRDLSATSSDAALRVQVNASEAGANAQEYTVSVNLLEAKSLGTQVSRIALTPVTIAGETLPPAELEVRYRGVGDVGYLPEFSHVGSLLVGEPHSEQWRLFSRTKRPFRISKMRGMESGLLRISCDTAEQMANSHVLTVTLTPTIAGSVSAPIDIDWISDSTEQGTLQIPISVYGLQPSAP